MTSMTADAATSLRRPFPPESVGKLPKSTCRECAQSQRKRCDRHQWVQPCPECGNGHSSATIHLDFVGHAAVTDRLLTVDPEWTWEFSENDPTTGQPSLRHSLDPEGNLWIRLTICGVTRIGVGDGKSAKEKIGDAIRNAGMRFGMGLDLWAKENLVEFQQHAAAGTTPPIDSTVADPQDEQLDLQGDVATAMYAAFHAAALDVPLSAYVGQVLGRDVGTPPAMTVADAEVVTQALTRLPRRQAGEVSGDASPGEADAAPAVVPSGAAPEAAPEVEPEQNARANPRAIKPAQQRMMMSLFGKHDLTDDDAREERLRIVSVIVGRAVESTSKLTTGEASKVIDTLTKVEGPTELLAIANGGDLFDGAGS